MKETNLEISRNHSIQVWVEPTKGLCSFGVEFRLNCQSATPELNKAIIGVAIVDASAPGSEKVTEWVNPIRYVVENKTAFDEEAIEQVKAILVTTTNFRVNENCPPKMPALV